MPRFTFDNEGAFTNATNITVAAGATDSYLVLNSSGSAVDIDIQVGTQAFNSGQVLRVSGVPITLATGANNLRLDADEVIDVSLTASAGTDTLSWRVATAQSAHGLSVKRGTGHTAQYTQENPNISVATI